MASKVRVEKKNAKFGPNIVRAWFDTVINPLLRALEVEKKYLDNKHWTWRSGTANLEVVRPIQSIIGYEAMANLKLIFEFYPDMERMTREHEEKREKLLNACKELHRVIRENPELRKTYDEVMSDDSLSKLGITTAKRDIFPDGSEEYKLDFLTEYIVNNGEFSRYILVPSFWRKYREVFLAISDSPGISDHNKKTLEAGEFLLKTAEGFISLLEELRRKLSLEYDVPPYVYTAPVFAE